MAIRFSYTQEQLDAAVLAERRRCADIVEELRCAMDAAFQGEDASDFVDGYIDACNGCRDYILETPK